MLGGIAVLLMAAHVPASAQQDPLRTRLAELEQGGPVVIDKAPVMNGDAVAALYRKRDSRPIWTDAQRIRQLEAAISLAEQHGLNRSDYRPDAVAEALASASRAEAAQRERQAELEIALTDSLVRIVEHLRHGKVEPSSVYPDWNLNRRSGQAAELSNLSAAIARGEILAAVEHASPQYPVYKRLLQALAQYRQLKADGGWPTIDAGPKLQPDAVDPRVLQLRARLKVTGELAADAPMTDAYDADLVKAVQRFQTRHGLTADGEIGPRTLTALNASAAARVDQIRVNLERARWALHELRETYVVVDIAGYQASYVRDGKVIWQGRVQVGQPLRMTPVLKSKFTDIVLNPNWTVPPTVLSKDIIPGARKDPRDFEKRKLRIIDGDRNEIDPSEVDWTQYTEKNFPYVLRQDPGPGNALLHARHAQEGVVRPLRARLQLRLHPVGQADGARRAAARRFGALVAGQDQGGDRPGQDAHGGPDQARPGADPLLDRGRRRAGGDPVQARRLRPGPAGSAGIAETGGVSG